MRPPRSLLRLACSLGSVLLAGLLLSPACTAEERGLSSPPPVAVKPSDVPDRELQIRGGSATFEEQVLEKVNFERELNGGLPPLKGVNLLDSSSETHSSNMAVRNFFMHCDPDFNTNVGDRMTAAGYVWNAAAENIGAGYTDPTAVMAGWMASAGHRANILSPLYREIGVGYVSQAGDMADVRQSLTGQCPWTGFGAFAWVRYWTQNFGLRNNVYPAIIERESFDTSDPDVDLYLYGAGWAVDMRLRNEAGTWTPWQPFAANVTWILSPGDGTKTVNVELRNGVTVRSASDSIVLAGSDFIFGDGFETGDTSAWSQTVP